MFRIQLHSRYHIILIRQRKVLGHHGCLSLPLRPSDQHAHSDRRCRCQSSNNRNAHQAFLCNLIINQAPQTLRLQISLFQFQQTVIVAFRFGVIAELVVAQGEVVEAFATAVGGGTEDVGEEADAFLLVGTGGGFD